MEMLKQVKVVDSLLILILGILLFTVGLSQQEVVSFESRFYLFALEMWRHGVSWFPTTYSQPYPDYPVTSTLLIYFFAKLFHTLNKFVAVLPSAIASALVLVMTYQVGALRQRAWGWLAVGFLLFCSAFLMEARTISLDQFVTLVTVSSFYLVYSASFTGGRFRWGLIPLLMIGFVFRGPIGLIIPTGVVCSFYLMQHDYKKMVVFGLVSVLVLTLCIVLLMFMAYQAGGIAFMKNVLSMEVLNRVHDAHSPPWYFYLQTCLGSYAIVFPLMLFMLPGLLHKKNKLLLPLLGWIAIIFLGLSIVGDKKIRYILPIAPALALVCAYLLVSPAENTYLRWLRNIFYGFCAILPTLVLGLLYICYQRSLVLLPYAVLFLGFVVLQITTLTMLGIFRSAVSVFWVAIISFVLAQIFIVEPLIIKLNAAKEFVVSVEKVRVGLRAKLIFYREHADGLVIKYFINMPQEELPIFVSTPAELNKFNNKDLFVTSADYFLALPLTIKHQYHIVKEGNIGRDKVVVFSKSSFLPRGEF
jgi:4-amino-4-deoxy-L-arabinose transferase-like glycosyltransferase